MQKVNNKINSINFVKKELCESDKNYIGKRQGYASSKIYDCPYKYCHQNFSTRKKKNN